MTREHGERALLEFAAFMKEPTDLLRREGRAVGLVSPPPWTARNVALPVTMEPFAERELAQEAFTVGYRVRPEAFPMLA